MNASSLNRIASRAILAALVAAFAALAINWSTATAHASGAVITSDIVLVVEDSYDLGDRATLAIRNDGDVPYVYRKFQQACAFTYKDANGRSFQIPPATHCDLPEETEIAPGATVTVLTNWFLDECTLPGFFCFGVRPLPTGAYTISGALQSVGGEKRAEFSKTISITGPRFTTTDISIGFGVIVSDPPTGELPVFISLFNNGSAGYTVPQPLCYLRFVTPAGRGFSIPPAAQCDDVTERVLAPGGRLDVVTGWKLDECAQFGISECLTAQPLPPGVYTVSGALWSEDGQSYAEFSGTYTIIAPAPTPVPTHITVLPRTGGPAEGGAPGTARGMFALGAALALLGASLILAGATRAAASGKSARRVK